MLVQNTNTFFSHQPTVRSWFIPPSSTRGLLEACAYLVHWLHLYLTRKLPRNSYVRKEEWGPQKSKMSPNNKICQHVAKVLFPKLQSVENNHKYAFCCILLLFN